METFEDWLRTNAPRPNWKQCENNETVRVTGNGKASPAMACIADGKPCLALIWDDEASGGFPGVVFSDDPNELPIVVTVTLSATQARRLQRMVKP